jgi:hypothetical protein
MLASPELIEIKIVDDHDRMKTGIKVSDEENRPLSSRHKKEDGPSA